MSAILKAVQYERLFSAFRHSVDAFHLHHCTATVWFAGLALPLFAKAINKYDSIIPHNNDHWPLARNIYSMIVLMVSDRPMSKMTYEQ